MLRTIRILCAVVFFLAISLLFLDFTGTVHHWFGWMAKIQAVPALLALNVGVVIALLVLTFVFGRIYCSVICPLGVLQDIIARIGRTGKKLPYSFSPPKTWLRYGVLIVFLVAMLLGVGAFVALLDPYGAFGRIAHNLFAPLWQWGNNLLAHFAQRWDSYAFYEVDVWMKSLTTFLIASGTLLLLIVLAWRHGRTYCNTICPVGTALGFLSRYSWFRITIDEDKCNKCTVCARNCKAACIDSKNQQIDYSRCVVCGNCIGQCKHGAMSYKPYFPKPKEKVVTDETRRGFFTAIALTASASLAKAQEKGDGGLAVIIDKKRPVRDTPIIPPGSISFQNMRQRCTACQLCVSACPNQVLRPSERLETLMQPEMSYERGYCRTECVKCAEVCPAGAIRKITEADKSAIQIGFAVWNRQLCIVFRDQVSCDNCARHCPTEAIQMIPSDPNDAESLKIPAVNIERCIGCGACENLCPARPYSAIQVEGIERHRIV